MTQAEIAVKREVLLAELEEVRLQYEEKRVVIDARLHALRLRCKHPNGYSYTCMGDPGWRCPDCGYDR